MPATRTSDGRGVTNFTGRIVNRAATADVPCPMMLDDAVFPRPLQPAPRTLVASFLVVLVLVLAATAHFAVRSLDEARTPVPRAPATTSEQPTGAPSGDLDAPG